MEKDQNTPVIDVQNRNRIVVTAEHVAKEQKNEQLPNVTTKANNEREDEVSAEDQNPLIRGI
jgi:hypothetical protein